MAKEPRKLWSEINGIIGKNSGMESPITIRNQAGMTVTDADKILEQLNCHFASIALTFLRRTCPPDISTIVFGPGSCLTEVMITEDDVFNELSHLDSSKPAGPDGIPPKLLN